LADSALGAAGYVCTPHDKQSAELVERWKKDDNIIEIYFTAATFSDESFGYFPNRSNTYILASFQDMNDVLRVIAESGRDRLSFSFSYSSPLFERMGDKLNYLSLYFTKYTNGDMEIGDLANTIARRDRVTKASLAQMQMLASEQPRFAFPYSKNVVILEVEGDKTHQTDHKYCERTRRDVAKKGILLNNLISFSILEKLK
jgi:hypothetical protein